MDRPSSLQVSPVVYDPADPDIRRDPFAVYRALRDHDPIHWSPPLRSWIITRHDDIKDIALSDGMSADRLADFYRSMPTATQETLAEVVRYLSLWLAFRDPPEHRRLRKLMNGAINPITARTQRPLIEAVVEEMVGRLEPGTEIDLIADLAMHVPAAVIMDMLDVPRERMHDLKRWSNELALFIGSARGVPDKYERARDGMRDMAAFFRDQIERRRAAPGDDLLSQMIAARDEGDQLSEDELVATCILILFAGHETTTNLIGNSVHMLLDHPDQLALLRERPELIEVAVEEFLRFDGPSNSLCRMVAVDHDIRGRRLARGDRLFCMLNSGNRDERAFPDPDRLDITRNPNRHLTFGQGIHFCIGAPLARIEAQVCLNALIARFPNLRPADTEPEWLDALIMRGMKSYRVRL